MIQLPSHSSAVCIPKIRVLAAGQKQSQASMGPASVGPATNTGDQEAQMLTVTRDHVIWVKGAGVP